MTTRIKLRRDTAQNWTMINPILASGEPGLETDTGQTKYGDGVTRWIDLAYAGANALTNVGAITVQTGDSDRWFVRMRREDSTFNPYWDGVVVMSTTHDSEGNAIALAALNLDDGGVAMCKFTSAGDLIWKKSLGAVNNIYYTDSNVVVDADDNIICVLNQDSSVAIVLKINGATGAVLFSRNLDFGTSYTLTAIALDSDANIIIGGHFDFASDTAFVAKLNPTATSIIWQKSLTGDNSTSYVTTVAVDYNDAIIAAGYAEVAHTVNGQTVVDDVMMVAKIASTGTQIWQKTITLVDITPSKVTHISLDSVGNIYVTGTYYVDNPGVVQPWTSSLKTNAAVIFKLSTLGAVVWDRRVGPGECSWVGVSSAVGDDGDLYVYASTYKLNPAGVVDINNGVWNATLVLARYNKLTGAVIWQSYFDNPHAQDVPGLSNDAPWGGFATDLMSVKGDKILIGGAVRLGQSGPDMDSPWDNSDYFNQGFIAQFDTDATRWSAEGWTLEPSRVPGKLTNTLVTLPGPLSLQNDLTIAPAGSTNITSQAVGVSVRRTASKVNTWTFGKDGTLTNPEDSNIKLQQRQLGYATLYGKFPNYNADIWFETVCHDAEGFAYAVGSVWSASGNRAHIYKFAPEGGVVWSRQLHSGSGAQFTVAVTSGVYSVPTVTIGGTGYKVGDRILLIGSQLGGNNTNTLIVAVASITNDTDYVGSVATVTIVSGTAANVTNTYVDVQDVDDNAKCEVRSMAYNRVSGNIEVVVTTPTQLGDNLDSGWTETVILTLDSGSGTVVSTRTLQDQGDVYAYDIDISSTGKIAIAGQKFNEYAEYGAITPLAGSGVDKLRVAKADIDAEHFPGEDIPGGSNISDWWIYGTGITDQVQVQSVNNYTGLSGTVTAPTEAVTAVFSVSVVSGAYANINATTPGLGYRLGQKFKILGTALGGTTPANDLTFAVGVDGSGSINFVLDPMGTTTGSDQTYASLTPIKIVGTGATFNLIFDPTTGAITNSGIEAPGQDYFVGDEITIPGTSFAGGTSPANNIIVTVGTVDGSGAVGTITTVPSTIPTTHLLLRTNASVNYAAGGATFGIRQNLGGETFVWTPDMIPVIGGPTSDVFTGVAWNAAGTSLYAVGNGRYEVNYDQALVVKFTSAGVITASKYINNGMGENNAYAGAVALMASDSIVVVHNQYNADRDETNEVLVTKLDSSLNIVWQQFIGVKSDGEWQSPISNISVAVDPAKDEILIAWGANSSNNDSFGDDVPHIVKLDTDGEVIWKRQFGVHESDTRLSYNGYGNKALRIHGDQFTLVGNSEAPDDDNDNGFIVTLPLDGTGVGEHGIWTYVEPTDDVIKVWRLSGRTSTTFTPTPHTGAITNVTNIKYYYTNYPSEEFTFYPETILSNEGGAIEFADGSKQTFSTAIVPQVKISAGRYTLRPEDSGRHILIELSNYAVIIPNWQSVTLPVGYTVSIVNISNFDAYVTNESSGNLRGEMWLSNGDMKTPAIGFSDNGSGQMITLIKIKEGTKSDDAEDHGDIWLVAGADIYNND